MLIPFAIDEKSLSEPAEAYYDASEWGIFHKNLIKFYMTCGALCYFGDSWSAEHTENLLSLVPANYRQQWSVIIQKYPRLRPNFNWNGAIPSQSGCMFDTIEVGLMNSQRANLDFGFSEESVDIERKITSADGAEITLIKNAAYNTTMKYEEFENLAHKKAFVASTNSPTIEDEWQARFKRLICFENSPRFITIFDRFSFQAELKDPTSSTHHSTSNFIRRVDRDAHDNKVIKIICSNEVLSDQGRQSNSIPPKDKEFIIRELKNLKALCRYGKVSKIELVIIDGRKAQWQAHDRHIRFGNLYLWDLGSGTDIFDQLNRRRNVSVSFKTGQKVIEGYETAENFFLNSRDLIIFRTSV
jgi:hypothetical protein